MLLGIPGKKGLSKVGMTNTFLIAICEVPLLKSVMKKRAWWKPEINNNHNHNYNHKHNHNNNYYYNHHHSTATCKKQQHTHRTHSDQ